MSLTVCLRRDPRSLPAGTHVLAPVDTLRDAVRLLASALRGTLLGVPTSDAYAVEITEPSTFRGALEWARADFRGGGARRRAVFLTTPCDLGVAPHAAYTVAAADPADFAVDCPAGAAAPVAALLGLGRPDDAVLVAAFPGAATAEPLRAALAGATATDVRRGERALGRGRVRRDALATWCRAERVEGDLVLTDLRRLS